MKFRSKVDWWLHLTLFLWVSFNIWMIAALAIYQNVILLIMVLIFTPLTALLIVPMWFNTYYILDERGLTIKCGLGKRRVIPYEAIQSAISTKYPLASNALSLDRIEVKYKLEGNKFLDTTLISPLKKQEFFEILEQRNSNITIQKEPKPLDKSYKILLTVILTFVGVALLGSVVMLITGEFDPNVTVDESGITISGMYGLHVRAEDILNITLIEESMRTIPTGSGARTNGFAGFGQAQKGYFSSSIYGSHIRFVQARTAPTIHIERRAFDIFISFRDSDKTRALFEEMKDYQLTPYINVLP